MRTLLRLLRLVVVTALISVTLAGTGLVVAPRVGDIIGAHDSDHERISLAPLSERSLVFDRYGNVLAALHDEQNRVQVPLEQVPEPMVRTVLEIEDRDFYQHKGVNVRSVARALGANLESGAVSQGGSTITQQVVKNALVGNRQDLKRKLREALLATELEEQYTKDEILERYLNSVYFGNGAYGVQAAAELYFGLDVGQLGWAEAATLTSLIRAPNLYDPFRNPKLARERRRLVLETLADREVLAPGALEMLEAVPLPTEPIRPPKVESYFVEQVKQALLDDERLGETPTARYNSVFGGGLRIYTTYDPGWQLKAEEGRNETLPNNQGDATFALSPDPTTGQPRFGTAAFAAVEPDTGAVRAIVGGPGFDRFQYDIASQGLGRQPGSSFKTFVLTQALIDGHSPTDTIDGHGPCGDVPGNWTNGPPGNYGGSRGGIATLESQTLKSSNCAFLRLGQVVGLERVASLAHRMGIDTPLNPADSAMPIGVHEVHPIDMAAAYATFANDGIFNPAYLVDRVTDSKGRIVFEHRPEPTRVLSRDVARLVTSVLEKNVQKGTGTRARLASGQPAAGKTGTTQNATDIWFAGYTPQISVAVWIGSPQGRVRLAFGGGDATGGRYAATMWGAVVGRLLDGAPIEEFPEPPERKGGTCLKMENQRSCYASSSRRRRSSSGRSVVLPDRPDRPEPTGTDIPLEGPRPR